MQKRTFTFLGTNGDEELRLWSTNTRRGLRVLARMGGGDDRVNVLETASARVRGGSGDDRMVGSHGNDRLLGGGGRDVADGRSGADTCQAEVIVACER